MSNELNNLGGIIFQDNFNRSNTNSLGGQWIHGGDNYIGITDEEAAFKSVVNNTSGAMAFTDLNKKDYYVEIEFSVLAENQYFYIKGRNDSYFIAILYKNQQLRVIESLNWDFEYSYYQVSLKSGDTVGAYCLDNTIGIYVNRVKVIDYVIKNTGFKNYTKAGMIMYPNSDARFDNFIAYDINDKSIVVTGVEVNVSINIGETVQLVETVSPSNATNKNVTWTSSDTSIATVSSNGLVTGIKAGSATITVTTVDGGKTATCNIKVQSTVVSVTGVSLNINNTTINVGGTVQLVATVSPSNATNKNVTWTSSDTSIATVSSNGLVTGIKAGSATITVTTVDGGKTANSSITVASSGLIPNIVVPPLVSVVDDGDYSVGYFNDPQITGTTVSTGVVYFLSEYGDDINGDGSNTSPWKTINKVRSYVDGLSSKPVKVTIMMADGDYVLKQTEIIRGNYFGTASCPVEIRGIGNRARITTGTKIASDEFVEVDSSSAPGNTACYSYDLSNIPDWNTGNNVFDFNISDPAPNWDQAKNGNKQANISDMPFVSVNGERLWLASYPNKQDLLKISGATGSMTGSAFTGTQTIYIPNGPVRSKLNTFTGLNNKITDRVFCQVYWDYLYYGETTVVNSYSSSNGALVTSRGSLNESSSPNSSQLKMKLFNVKEQLNESGTYWIDYSNKKLYIIPPDGTDMSNADIMLAQAQIGSTNASRALIATNSTSETYVTFERISFSDHRSNVFLSTSSNTLKGVNFYKCRFTNIGRSAFGCNTSYGHYSTGGTDLITNCEWREGRFGYIGEYSLFIVGADRDVRALESDNNKAYNCIFNYANGCYGGFLPNLLNSIYYYGCGMDVEGNKFANSPGIAVYWRANDLMINDNIFYQCVWSEGDSGCVYMGADWTFRGTVITNNIFRGGFQVDRNSGSGTAGVYCDDLSSSAEIKNNNITNFMKGIMMGGGRDSDIQNNTITNCTYGIIFDNRGMTWADLTPVIIFTNSVPWTYWRNKYPALNTLVVMTVAEANVRTTNALPYGNTIKNNTITNCTYPTNINPNVVSLGDVSNNG